MSSTTVAEMECTIVSSSDNLKTLLQGLTDQSTQLKSLMNTVRTVLKDVEKQNKELEKLRNKKTRTKTERSANALPSGITKPVSITDELATFLGVPAGTLVPRNEVTKGVSSYVKKHELYDKENKQKFILDSRPEAQVLKTLLGNPTEGVTYFNLQRYLKHHYLNIGEKAVPAVVTEVVVTPTTVVVEAPKKKVVMMVKKKKSELTEEST
jgi:chromatin remodeling complex protein RSC6